MRYSADRHTYTELTDKVGNPYNAVSLIAAMARKLAEDNDNVISHSEALSWVLHGERPCLESRRRYIQNVTKHKISYIDDLLSGVDDNYVCDSVRRSVELSEKNRHLIYVYKDVDDEPRRARVRILTRMIWYDLHP